MQFFLYNNVIISAVEKVCTFHVVAFRKLTTI